MMVQAPVIQIDGSAGCHLIVCNAHFGMAEARLPFEDTDTVSYQSAIKRSGHAVDKLFIGLSA